MAASDLSPEEIRRADRAVADGLLVRDGERWVPTDRGRLLADGVIRDVLS